MRSIGGRLVALAAALSLLTLAGAGALIAAGLRDFVAERFEADLEATVIAVLAGVEAGEDGAPLLLAPPADPRFFRPLSGWYWQVSQGGALALGSSSLGGGAFSVPEGESEGAGVRTGAGTGPEGEALRVLARRVEVPDLGAVDVAAAAPMAEIDAAAAAAVRPLAAALGLLGVGLTGAIALQARWGLAPLRRLRRDLGRVRAGEIEALPPERVAEIAPVVEELNALLAENRAVAARARAHVADLSHALKTPLSVVVNALERKAPGLATPPDPALAAARLMDRLIRRRLGRARASARARGARAALGLVIEDVALVLGPEARRRGLALSTRAEPGAVFAGEAEDAAEMIGPLAENACRWARGRLAIEARREGGRVLVVVGDDGPGMSPERAARALRRGERLDAAGPGEGLGLAIAEDLARLSGGSLALGRSALGGLEARLDLPAAPLAADARAGR